MNCGDRVQPEWVGDEFCSLWVVAKSGIGTCHKTEWGIQYHDHVIQKQRVGALDRPTIRGRSTE
jgi:hypothetical protein